MATARLLLVTGSTRRRSTNTAALLSAREILDGGASADVFDGLAGLPPFNPDDDFEPLPAEVVALRSAIARADAVVFCTPEYAGTVPGTLKNLLDWTVGGPEMYGKPAAWINVGGAGRGAGAEATLATVLGYVGARVLPSSGVRVTVPRDAIGEDGLIADAAVRASLADALRAIVAEARAS